MLEVREEILDGAIDDSGGHHQPVGPWRLELLDEFFDGRRTHRPLPGKPQQDFRTSAIDDTLVASTQYPPHHVPANPPESDHSDLHSVFPLVWVSYSR